MRPFPMSRTPVERPSDLRAAAGPARPTMQHPPHTSTPGGAENAIQSEPSAARSQRVAGDVEVRRAMPERP